MTSVAAASGPSGAADGPLRARLRTPIVWINLAGLVLVAAGVVPIHGGRPTGLGLGAAIAALAAWLVWSLLPAGRPRAAALAAGSVLASVGTGLGRGPLVAAAIAGLVVAVGDVRHRPALGATIALLDVVALTAAAAASGMPVSDLLSYLAGVVFGGLLGVTRRQRRAAELRERTLLRQALAAEQEAARIRLLEDRAAAAREVHDLLAHGLGGLVLQLDAIDALLEHGRHEEAATRVAQARTLAGESLSEARRAVAVLRDPEADSAPPPGDAALEDLVAVHRSLGAAAAVTGDLDLAGLPAPARAAMVRALQEALANARRHAPGESVSIRIDREAHAFVLEVANPLPARPVTTSSGGHGLDGMRERFAALGGGARASAGPRDGRFVVEARVPR